MERRSIKITTLVLLVSFLCVAAEFSVYYFIDKFWPVCLITVIAAFIVSHLFLEASLTYTTCFLFSLTSMVLSSILTTTIYFGQTGNILVYHDYVQFIIYGNWLIPLTYSTFRCLFDRGPRFVNFKSYFIKTSILFLLFYLFNLVYHTIFSPLQLPYGFDKQQIAFLPFLTTATHIEDFIYTGNGIGSLVGYIIKIFILFMPMGFYIALILKKNNFILKAFLVIIIPILFEIVPYVTQEYANIDSCIYRFFSLIIGVLCFQLLNGVFRYFTGEDFLYERNKYSFFLNQY